MKFAKMFFEWTNAREGLIDYILFVLFVLLTGIYRLTNLSWNITHKGSKDGIDLSRDYWIIRVTMTEFLIVLRLWNYIDDHQKTLETIPKQLIWGECSKESSPNFKWQTGIKGVKLLSLTNSIRMKPGGSIPQLSNNLYPESN